MRILVIDDEVELQELLERWLSDRNGHSVTCIAGPEGISELADQRFDVILLDYHLRNCFGLDLVNDLRSTWSSALIVLMSGRGPTLDFPSSGVDAYIAKPLNLPLLTCFLEALVRPQAPEAGSQSGEAATCHQEELA